MRNICAFTLVVFLLSACATSNTVASDKLIQKRKYRKGWHLNVSKHSNQKMSLDSEKEELVVYFSQDSVNQKSDNKEKQEVLEEKELQSHTVYSSSINSELVSEVDEIPKKKTQKILMEIAPTFSSNSWFYPDKKAENNAIAEHEENRSLRAFLGVLVLFITGISPLAVWIAIGKGEALDKNFKLFLWSLILLVAFLVVFSYAATTITATATGSLLSLMILFGAGSIIMGIVSMVHALIVIIRGY